MSSLTHIEKQKLERELAMSGGYVLNFTNRTFEEFFREVVGVQIYDPRFNLSSGSKANRMRAFWQVATDEQLRLLLSGLIDGWDLSEMLRLKLPFPRILEAKVRNAAETGNPFVPVRELLVT